MTHFLLPLDKVRPSREWEFCAGSRVVRHHLAKPWKEKEIKLNDYTNHEINTIK